MGRLCSRGVLRSDSCSKASACGVHAECVLLLLLGAQGAQLQFMPSVVCLSFGQGDLAMTTCVPAGGQGSLAQAKGWHHAC